MLGRLLRWCRLRPNRDERGHLLVITAASLPVLIVFTAFSVDSGSWYARAAQVQRAADAAALAGVVWMPDFPKAQAVALQQATQNGFTSAGSVTVAVSPVPGDERRLKVTITDADVPALFSGAFRGPQSITRSAVAEYVNKVPLGSPKNILGSGDTISGPDREGFWAAVSGYCSGHESGDLKLPRYESYTTTASGQQCYNTYAPSADYDPDGYLYAIDLPADATSLALDSYDPGYHRTGSQSDFSHALSTDPQTVTTVYEFYRADSTPLDSGDNPMDGAPLEILTDDPAYPQNAWHRLHTFTPAPAGTYYVRIKTKVQTSDSRASNGFGLRAFTTPSFQTCTTVSGEPGYSPSCPHIHGVTDMSIYASLPGGSGSVATFYLAQIKAYHGGKTMQVTLFDPGEGAQTIEVLDPNGNPATFDWATPCDPPVPPTGGCRGSNVSSLSVNGTGPSPDPSVPLKSTFKYNDRKMVLSVKLPANYSTAYGGREWWRIRYTVGSTATDRTTWSVTVLGDPVHLVGG